VLLLETCCPSYRAAEAAGGVQVDVPVQRAGVRGKPMLWYTLLAPRCQKSHHLIGDHKATQWQNKAQSTEAELIKRTEFLISRWKIPHW